MNEKSIHIRYFAPVDESSPIILFSRLAVLQCYPQHFLPELVSPEIVSAFLHHFCTIKEQIAVGIIILVVNVAGKVIAPEAIVNILLYGAPEHGAYESD